MTTFARYLRYRLKNTAERSLIFTVMAVILAMIAIPEDLSSNEKYSDIALYILAIIMSVLATLVPMLETAAFKNRRNLDTLYFFPIQRWKMATAHFISGFVQVLFVYTVTFAVSWMYLAIEASYFDLSYMPMYYIGSVVLGLVMYSFFIFIFAQANTVADGVVFCVAWMFAGCMILLAANTLTAVIFGKAFIADVSNGIVYAPVNWFTTVMQYVMEINKENVYYRMSISDLWTDKNMFLVWIIVGLVSAGGYIYTFMEKGAAKAGEISSSWLGYKLLIPLYGYVCMRFIRIESYPLVLLTLVAMVICYMVYRRGIRFKKSDIIVLACSLLPLLIK